ncbi:hypothetical protein [Caulobacter segnis]|uniref:hypothetical protein n=1 Tax=Caulobacter segnis TaxID=88688 RepID=UPI0026F32AE7|nr:hypothetical protein [Caulobacter segnis]
MAVNMVTSPADQIAALRITFEAATDMELAEKLGVVRSAVAQWRSRGVPKKYAALIPKTDAEIANAVDTALRINLFHKPGNSFIVASASVILHDGPLSECRLDTPEKARAFERLMLRIASVAINATNIELMKETCETQEDYLHLVHLLRTKYADQVANVIAKFAPALGLSVR